MNFTKIALAAAVTLVAAQAQAATVYLAGASATAANYRAALTSLCSGAATTYTNTSDSNKFAVKCSVNFTGIPGVDAVSFNVSGGSFTAITTSVGNATDVFVDVAAANPNTALTAARKSEGGFLDIDAAAFPASELANAGLSAAPATSAASFSQVFGVAVSPDLYTALQAAQGLTGCGVDSLTQACQPTITKAQYTSIVNDSFNTAKQDINATLGVGNAGDKLTVCRRVSTSGTQASSGQFFLNTFVGGDGAAAGALTPADQATYGATSGLTSYEVVEGAGTGNARTCLSNTGYAVGVLSLENYPDLTTRTGGQRADRKWRYVKINGIAAYDGNETTAGKSTASAKAGKYEFWFTSQKFGATTNGTNVINAIDAKLGSTDLNGLFGNATSAAQRTSNTSPIFFN